MRVTVWMALVCAIGHQFLTVTEATNPRSVNLAIEASVLLEPEDVKQNNVVLTKIRRFLDQIGNAFAPIEEPVLRSVGNTGVLTNFISQICVTALKYHDEDLEKLQKAIIDVAETKLDVIDKSNDLATIVKGNLKYLGAGVIHDLKNKLNGCLKKGDDLLETGRLDKFYNDADAKKFDDVLARLGNYSTHGNLTAIVNDALKLAVNDKYKDLQEPKKSQFYTEIENVQKHIRLIANKFFIEKSNINNTEKDTSVNENNKTMVNEDANEIVFNKDVVINVGGEQNRGNDNSLQDKGTSREESDQFDGH